MLTQYEHHAAIRQNKDCPYLLRIGKNIRDTVCNWHQNIEMFLITNGQGQIRCGANEYPLSPSDVVVVNSGTVHRIYSETGIDYYCVIIDEQFCKENGLDTEHCRFSERFCDPKTEALFLRMIALMTKNERESSQLETAKLRIAILTLLVDLFENHLPDPRNTVEQSSRSDEYVKKALLYINEHYTSPITLDEIAAAVGVSKFHLERAFKKYTDQTIFTYLNILRCKNAAQCIRDGMTVTQAAYENGFESLSYFSRIYKKLMGSSPSKSV